MRLSQCFQPRSQIGRDFFVPRLHRLDPRQFTLQRGRNVDWRPADVQKAFCKTSGGHGCNVP
jgi:hypothetical protein